ncbi:DUF3616 domain-containing protein [Starkeya sp. ORNL1]|uniref:DUF3616 domain-containing protein n=1 Tax=Starkeya sp. ORNL1 TaxID=2709380 RepID=UPI00146433AB|nr:DUF3616 domain-containing protein [Starkeya sp. ORNL1]QJP16083.1 DUF3616 domain-containing protein [Starkeya sp. ORNL1]
MRSQAVTRIVSASLIGAALLMGAPAKATSGTVFAVSGELIGKSKKNGDVKGARDLSGIACAEPSGFPRHCLVVDDEAQSAQFVVVNDGLIVAGDPVPLTDNMLGGKPLEFDGEGVGFADGAFYVIGSHGHPRDKGHSDDQPEDKEKFAERIDTVSVIQRIAVEPADTAGAWPKAPPTITRSTALHALLAADQELRPFVDQRLEKNGLTIEGVAVRGGRLYAGLRAPVLENGTRAAILGVNLDGLFDGTPAEPRLFKLALGEGRGVRDLVRYKDGFLVLAGPSADPDDRLDIPSNAYSVFWWDGEAELKPLGDIEGMKVSNKKWAKPEALLPLDADSDGLSVLVLFDGAPAKSAARADMIRKP